jgi:hypothetical protein
MAKRREDLENPMIQNKVIPYRRPEKLMPNEVLCNCGCGYSIELGIDDYIAIDGEYFLYDSCVADYFIKETGGKRVYGGAC